MLMEIQLTVELHLTKEHLRLNSSVYLENRSDLSMKKKTIKLINYLNFFLQKVVEQIVHLLLIYQFHVVIKYIVLIIEHTI